MIDPLVVAAKRWPDAVALADAGRRWTWRDVLADANDLARRLDVPSRSRVSLLARDTGDAVIAIHAVRLAGAVLVPLHRRLALAELHAQVMRSGSTRLVHDDAHRSLAAELGSSIGALSLEPLGRRAAVAGPTEVRALDEDTLGALVFTSGTTGAPRGALLTHANLLASARAWNGFLGAGLDDHWLAALPLSHVAGMGIVLRSMCSGARLSVHDRFEPDAVRAALAQEGVSHVSLVPTQLQRLLEAGPVEAPRLRALLLGGAPIPSTLVDRAVTAGLPIVSTYGLTEAASGVTASTPAETSRYPGGSGKPLPGMRVRIVADGVTDVASGGVGDILVAGPTVFAGYDGDPAATGLVLRNGWMHTGDVGMLDRDGRLSVIDRRDDLIISGGENIAPAEVEAVLVAHPDVAEAAVVGRSDATWGAVPIAAVVLRPGGPADMADLTSYARQRLAGYKVPTTIVAVTAIPRTASGKVLRREVGRLIELEARDLMVARPDGAQLHVRRRGSGPILVLLHATLSNVVELEPLSSTLAAHWTVLAIDRRSAGASCMPPDDARGPVDVQSHVDDIVAVLDALAPGHAAFLVGHSYGGCVGLELAARHPDRVAGAWLFEPPYLSVLPDGPDTATGLGRRITAIANDAGMGAAALAFLETVNGPEVLRRLPPDAIARFEREGRSAVADSALLGLRPDDLQAIVAPVVIGIGGRSRGPYEVVAEGLAQRIAGCSVERFPTLGHGGPVSQPGLVAAAIQAAATQAGHAGAPVQPPGGTP